MTAFQSGRTKEKGHGGEPWPSGERASGVQIVGFCLSRAAHGNGQRARAARWARAAMATERIRTVEDMRRMIGQIRSCRSPLFVLSYSYFRSMAALEPSRSISFRMRLNFSASCGLIARLQAMYSPDSSNLKSGTI